ncbi:hypothetical protein F7396_20025 [Salmonella enterica]|nr:hypothetical protein [Salmonella enterica subsp. enterica serovar Sandiego]ECF1356147.1 hypothetical protein [Salmonella enterica subsp. enterica serovar Sandiego]ECZ0995761.1 hypothetical protein [Salmonella enterica]EHJ0329309.1 hypothetical protein [Salmonella enterica]
MSLSHRTGTSVSTQWLDGVLCQTGVTGLERGAYAMKDLLELTGLPVQLICWIKNPDLCPAEYLA